VTGKRDVRVPEKKLLHEGGGANVGGGGGGRGVGDGGEKMRNRITVGGRKEDKREVGGRGNLVMGLVSKKGKIKFAGGGRQGKLKGPRQRSVREPGGCGGGRKKILRGRRGGDHPSLKGGKMGNPSGPWEKLGNTHTV